MRIVYLLGVALVSAAALASPAAAADTPAVNADKPDQPEKVICKREQTVGTRLAPRVCLTKADWRRRQIALDEHNRTLKDRADREVHDRPLVGTPTNGN